jgi:cytochrome c553
MRYQYCFILMWFAALLPTHGNCDSRDSLRPGVPLQSMPIGARQGTNGKQIAETICSACHGPQGISASDDYPDLAGQMPMYIVSSLRSYKNGTRQAPLMNDVAAKLSEQDIAALAVYYAGLKPAE